MKKSFEEASALLFQRFTQTLAKVDLRSAVAVPAMAGAVLAWAGSGMEVNGQLHLLQSGGQAALDAYTHAMDGLQAHSIIDFVQQGLAGQRPSFGGNTEARGITLMSIGPALSAATVLLSRGFEKVSGLAKDMSERFSNAAQSQGNNHWSTDDIRDFAQATHPQWSHNDVNAFMDHSKNEVQQDYELYSHEYETQSSVPRG